MAFPIVGIFVTAVVAGVGATVGTKLANDYALPFITDKIIPKARKILKTLHQKHTSQNNNETSIEI